MYVVRYKKSVDKDLRHLSKTYRQSIIKKIQDLARNPRPQGAIKLRGSHDLLRIRHADYRIVYQINDHEVTVLIIKVGHRREIYKDI